MVINKKLEKFERERLAKIHKERVEAARYGGKKPRAASSGVSRPLAPKAPQQQSSTMSLMARVEKECGWDSGIGISFREPVERPAKANRALHYLPKKETGGVFPSLGYSRLEIIEMEREKEKLREEREREARERMRVKEMPALGGVPATSRRNPPLASQRSAPARSAPATHRAPAAAGAGSNAAPSAPGAPAASFVPRPPVSPRKRGNGNNVRVSRHIPVMAREFLDSAKKGAKRDSKAREELRGTAKNLIEALEQTIRDDEEGRLGADPDDDGENGGNEAEDDDGYLEESFEVLTATVAALYNLTANMDEMEGTRPASGQDLYASIFTDEEDETDDGAVRSREEKWAEEEGEEERRRGEEKRGEDGAEERSYEADFEGSLSVAVMAVDTVVLGLTQEYSANFDESALDFDASARDLENARDFEKSARDFESAHDFDEEEEEGGGYLRTESGEGKKYEFSEGVPLTYRPVHFKPGAVPPKKREESMEKEKTEREIEEENRKRYAFKPAVL